MEDFCDFCRARLFVVNQNEKMKNVGKRKYLQEFIGKRNDDEMR